MRIPKLSFAQSVFLSVERCGCVGVPDKQAADANAAAWAAYYAQYYGQAGGGQGIQSMPQPQQQQQAPQQQQQPTQQPQQPGQPQQQQQPGECDTFSYWLQNCLIQSCDCTVTNDSDK